MQHKNTVLKTVENKLKIKEALDWMHKNVYGKNHSQKVEDLTKNSKGKTTNKNK